MEKYVGFVVEEGLKDPDVLDYFDVISKEKGKNWTKVGIEINPGEVRKVVRIIQSSLRKNFFFYLHKGGKFIVVFPDRQFWMIDKEDLREAKSYGVSIGIPEDQMVFDF